LLSFFQSSYFLLSLNFFTCFRYYPLIHSFFFIVPPFFISFPVVPLFPPWTVWLCLSPLVVCFILFYLFYFILFYLILFYFILYYIGIISFVGRKWRTAECHEEVPSILYFILFYFILFYFILFYFISQEVDSFRESAGSNRSRERFTEHLKCRLHFDERRAKKEVHWHFNGYF